MGNISFQRIESAALYEPRIEFIKRQLESLLSVVELEKDGEVVKVNGFRLKNLTDWLVPSACDPVEVFGYAGARCNCDCLFCCNRGNPPSLSSRNPSRQAAEELDEMRTRIEYSFPKAGMSLFPSLGSIYEVLMHPRILEVLHLLRERSSQVLRINTNGENLTPELIAALAELKPIYLYLSLNSASPLRRKKLMQDKNPDIAINAPPLLREVGIPYAIVIVPWPVDSLNEMLADLVKTAIYADEREAHLIQVNLPGYSRYFSAEKLFNLDEVWSATVSLVRKLRSEISSPIVAMPTMYEENLYEERKNLPRIIGLVRNSPAAKSGLMKGDLILKINGLPIFSRPQARDILSLLCSTGNKEVYLTIKREEHILDIAMHLDDSSYPYSREIDNYLGMIFLGTGLRLSYLEALRELIDVHKAKHVLFLTSSLVKPTLEQCLNESHLFDDKESKIDLEIPTNNFFGGNIFMGDLLVVQDFIDWIEEDLKRGAKPDLIIIPTSPFSLSGWGRDLTGRSYLDIERKVGIPVELLECSPIYD